VTAAPPGAAARRYADEAGPSRLQQRGDGGPNGQPPADEDGEYVVRVPALTGCCTQEGTLDRALARAREAIAGHVAARRNLGKPGPVEAMPPIVAAADIAPAA
jgi:predicted RNase H-like HicB family nuclease